MNAVKLGDLSVDISQKLPCSKVELYMIPQVAQLMIMVGKLRRAAALITELPRHNVWHHVLSLDFILSTGFAIEKSTNSVAALQAVVANKDRVEPEVYRSAVATICLWTLRTADRDS